MVNSPWKTCRVVHSPSRTVVSLARFTVPLCERNCFFSIASVTDGSINLPQAAVLGMHSIKEKPVVVDGQIVIRPIMVVALTYDHRLLDGREAVTFLGESSLKNFMWDTTDGQSESKSTLKTHAGCCSLRLFDCSFVRRRVYTLRDRQGGGTGCSIRIQCMAPCMIAHNLSKLPVAIDSSRRGGAREQRKHRILTSTLVCFNF